MQDIWLHCRCKGKTLPPQTPITVSVTGGYLFEVGQWATRCRNGVERGNSTISKRGVNYQGPKGTLAKDGETATSWAHSGT